MKKKILHILAQKPVGGVGTFIKNIYNENNFYSIEIVQSAEDLDSEFDKFFIDRGVKINLFPKFNMNNLMKYFIFCEKFYRENSMNYNAIHIHSTYIAAVHIFFAKKYNIENIFFHAHLNITSGFKFKTLLSKINMFYIKNNCTKLLSCGIEVGVSVYNSNNFTTILNPISVERFKFDLKKRNIIRSELGISDKKVAGIVGRFDYEKNQKFILEVADRSKWNRNIHYLFIGDGYNLDKLKKLSETLELDNVSFLGRKSNVNDYYNAMDCLLLPSFKEGFSLVAIEAQCNGLPVIFSSSLARSMDILKYGLFLETDNKNIKNWISFIDNYACFDFDKRKLSKEIVSKKHSLVESRESLNKFYRRNIL